MEEGEAAFQVRVRPFQSPDDGAPAVLGRRRR